MFDINELEDKFNITMDDIILLTNNDDDIYQDISNKLMDNNRTIEKSIDFLQYCIQHNYTNIGYLYFLLGNIYQSNTCFHIAIEQYLLALQYEYINFIIYNNLGVMYDYIGNKQQSLHYFHLSLSLNPNNGIVYWNLVGLSSTIDDAILLLDKALLNITDEDNIGKLEQENIYTIHKHGLLSIKNKMIDTMLLNLSLNPITRSYRWYLNLPYKPNIFFSRWDFFDYINQLTPSYRPFYEFGVSYGYSFQYLIQSYPYGYGFDTFTGIPEKWYDEKIGTYGTNNNIPTIENGEFIVGEFKDSLPKFFQYKRDVAGLIHLDADLYSSTITALKYSKDIIDNKTILIFDEFLINPNWEEDEYKALNEFCSLYNKKYKVIAVSFRSKQVAVQLVN